MPHNFWSFFKIPTVFISYYSVVAVTFSFGFLQPLLEVHLRQFSLSTVPLTFMFIINGGLFALTSVLCGHLVDKKLHPKIINGTGAILVVVSFLLIGPAPFLPANPALWLVIIALVLQGTGCGAIYIASYLDCNQEVIRHGFPDNIQTYGMISGLWGSGLALGACLGPSVAGLMQDAVGFRNACMLVVGVHALLIFLNFGHLLFESRKKLIPYEPFLHD